MIRLKNILVATDFSEASGAALAYGRDLARSYEGTLHVLHVADNVMTRFTGEASMAFLPDLQLEVEKGARERLQALLDDEDHAMLHARPVVVTSMAISEAISAYASDHQIDLVVLGTHGRGAVAHFLLGSVAERVVRTAPCPVLTVKHPEREFLVPDALVPVDRG